MRNRRILTMILACFAFACSTPVEPEDGGAIDDAGHEDSIDAATDDASDAAVRACSAEDPTDCAYRPPIDVPAGAELAHELVYTDAAGLERAIEIQVRLPGGTAGSAPVVVWSHGGADGIANAEGVGREWSEQIVRAGYAVVAIAHRGRTPEQYSALCSAVGFTSCETIVCSNEADCSSEGEGACVAGACRYWKHLSWDRPQDLRAVLDFLERETIAGGAYEGALDPSRIVYAGHSAGAGSTMMVAGAAREIAGEDVVAVDARPIAFVSCSPQGPGDDGFTADSFSGESCRAAATDPSICLERPHLTLTGAGDDTDGVGENRRLSFDFAPATGERYLAFIKEEAARHTTFDYGVEACMRFAQDEGLDPSLFPERCNHYRLWLRSTMIAFLDAVTSDSADARAWLTSLNLGILSGSGVSIEQR